MFKRLLGFTARAEWAKGDFQTEEDFLKAQANGDTPGLQLKYDNDGNPYLDEGECEGPFAEPE